MNSMPCIPVPRKIVTFLYLFSLFLFLPPINQGINFHPSSNASFDFAAFVSP